MLSARVARTVINNVAVRTQAFSQVKVVYTNLKHKDMGGGGHFGYDINRDDPVNQDQSDHGHHHDDHHDPHAHPVFHLPFSRTEAFMSSWFILFAGMGAVLLSCGFQQRKQGFTTIKDRFTE